MTSGRRDDRRPGRVASVQSTFAMNRTERRSFVTSPRIAASRLMSALVRVARQGGQLGNRRWWSAFVMAGVLTLAGCGGSDANRTDGREASTATEPRELRAPEDLPIAKTTAPTEEEVRMVTTGDFADFVASRSEPPIPGCGPMQPTLVAPQYADVGAVRFAQASCNSFVFEGAVAAKMRRPDAAQDAVDNPEPWLFTFTSPPADIRKSERDGATCWVVPAQPGGVEFDQSVCFQAVGDLLMVVTGGRDGSLEDVQAAIGQAADWAG